MPLSSTVTADIAVLGAGPSGLTAAHTAALAGADVVIVDATGELGGNGAFSSGYMAFAGTSMQRELGIDDTPELFLRDMTAEVERKRAGFDPHFNVPVARRFADRSADGFDYLFGLGFSFGRFVPRPGQHSVSRMLSLRDATDFNRVFGKVIEAAKIRVMFRSRVSDLLSDRDVIVGARVSRPSGRDFDVRADRTIVCTGGYQANAELRARYQPRFDPHAPYQGLDTIVGDGQMMIERAGGELVNMHMVPELVKISSRLVEECIAVNESGRRFCDEAGPYSERVAALRRQPGGIGYFLCDETTSQRLPQLIADLPGTARHAATIADAARLIGAPAAVLESTVAQWNSVVESGAARDPEFGRVVFPDPRAGIRRPPFSVVRMKIGTDISAGGALVSPDLEVLRADGTPVPSLYAAGDCCGAVNAAAGLGGVHLASAVTLARVAVQAAVGTLS
jgi:succinate dehydrogenase/fumarate reductase flavoprotein subunit